MSDVMSVRLHLRGVRVVKVLVDTVDRLVVEVVSAREWSRCQHCGFRCHKVWDRRAKRVRDLGVSGRRTMLVWRHGSSAATVRSVISRICHHPTLRLYPAAERPHRGETAVPRRRRSVPPAVLENAVYPLGGEPVERARSAPRSPTTACPGCGRSCVARWRTAVWPLGTDRRLGRGWGHGVVGGTETSTTVSAVTRDIRQGSRVWWLPEPPAYRGFHLRVTRDNGPISPLSGKAIRWQLRPMAWSV